MADTEARGPAASGAPAPRRGGLRWGVALVLVAVVVGALGTLGTLVSTPTPPDAITFVPSGSLAVLEVRPDLPGDQREALGAVLLRIPDFSDVANLNDRVNAALDEAARRATDGATTYTGEIRPYAAGAALVAVLPPVDGASGDEPRGLAVLTTESAPGCAPLESGRQVTVERYRDTEIRVVVPAATPSAPPAAAAPSASGPRQIAGGARPWACAVAGRFVLVGDPSALRAGLDARAQGRNVSGDNGYGAAFRAFPQAHAAWGYLNVRSTSNLAGSLPIPTGFPIPSIIRPSQAAGSADAPAWAALQVRFMASGAVIETAMPDRRGALLAGLPAASGAAARTPAPAAASELAPILPASTVALLEGHDVASVIDALAAQSPAPGITTGSSPLGSITPSLGGAFSAAGPALGAGLLGDAGQAAAVVVAAGDAVAAGVVVQVRDGSALASSLDQLRLLGGLLGGVTSSDYKGTRILSVPLAALSRLGTGLNPVGPTASIRPSASPIAPAPSGSPGQVGTGGLDALAATQVLSVAAHGNVLIIGLGDGLAKAIIDTRAGASLADQAGYRNAMTAAGTPNLGSLYVDLAAMRSVGSKLAPVASAVPRASANPFLEAAGVAAGSLTTADGLLTGRVVITVK